MSEASIAEMVLEGMAGVGGGREDAVEYLRKVTEGPEVAKAISSIHTILDAIQETCVSSEDSLAKFYDYLGYCITTLGMAMRDLDDPVPETTAIGEGGLDRKTIALVNIRVYRRIFGLEKSSRVLLMNCS